MPLPPNYEALPPQVQALISTLADGMIHKFLEFFPTGIADPNFKIVVQRQTVNGPIMQQTTFAQLTAEHIDEMKKLSKAVKELSALTAEALDETKPRRRR